MRNDFGRPCGPASGQPAGRRERSGRSRCSLRVGCGGTKGWALIAKRWLPLIAVLRADSSHAGSWSGTGRVLSLLGQEDRAVAAFQRALSLNPDDVAAHRGLGLIALHQQRYAAARQSYSRAVELGTWARTVPLQSRRGLTPRRAPTKRPVRQMRQAIELDEEYVLPYVALSRIYCAKLGECEEGVRLLRQALGTRTQRDLAARGTR